MTLAQVLETTRLRLRPIAVADSAFIAGLISDPAVRRYLGGPVAPDRQVATIADDLRDDPDGACWLVETKAPARPIGLVFESRHRDGADHELSFMFSPSVWGQGLAIEAAQRVLDHATGPVGLPRLIAETQAANRASRALLHRLGMVELRRIQRFGAEQIIYASGQPAGWLARMRRRLGFWT